VASPAVTGQKPEMNYRHHFHAGNFADVAKHALLVRLVRGLQRKPKGCLLLDTHAGRGEYDLTLASTGDTLARQPEFPGGIGRLWNRTDVPETLVEYLALVRDFDRSRSEGLGITSSLTGRSEASPRFYPGSPRLLSLLARPEDRLALCEKHPEECEALRISFFRDKRVSVQEIDGYRAPAAMLPPPEKRALVLIDPPFEDADEGRRIVGALRDGLRRLPAGTFAVWYPLTARARVESFFEELGVLSLPPTLAVEILVDPDSPKMRGSGLLMVNPPWQFEREAGPLAEFLAEALAQASGAGALLRWLVPE
jgi:23S rRNA (adenine2030-N6)-methyltransferase